MREEGEEGEGGREEGEGEEASCYHGEMARLTAAGPEKRYPWMSDVTGAALPRAAVSGVMYNVTLSHIPLYNVTLCITSRIMCHYVTACGIMQHNNIMHNA